MAINWTEAQVAELVAKVVAEMRADKTAAAASAWSSTQYGDRKLVGIYATMEETSAKFQRLPSARLRAFPNRRYGRVRFRRS